MYNTTVDILRPTVSTDSTGSSSKSYSAHLSGVVSAVQNIGNTEAVQYGGERGSMSFDIFFNTGIDVTGEDKIETADGLKLDIVIPRDAAGRGRVTHVVGVYELGVET